MTKQEILNKDIICEVLQAYNVKRGLCKNGAPKFQWNKTNIYTVACALARAKDVSELIDWINNQNNLSDLSKDLGVFVKGKKQYVTQINHLIDNNGGYEKNYGDKAPQVLNSITYPARNLTQVQQQPTPISNQQQNTAQTVQPTPNVSNDFYNIIGSKIKLPQVKAIITIYKNVSGIETYLSDVTVKAVVGALLRGSNDVPALTKYLNGLGYFTNIVDDLKGYRQDVVLDDKKLTKALSDSSEFKEYNFAISPDTPQDTKEIDFNHPSQEEIKFREKVSQMVLDFFSEYLFDSKESNRFVNTLYWQAKKSFEEAKTYIVNYFKVTGNPDTNNVSEKIKSHAREFEQILAELVKIHSNKVINDRLEIMFGNPGIGKSYEVSRKYPNVKKMSASSDLEPLDLIKAFTTGPNGQASFVKTSLVECLEAGEPLWVDEANLLSFTCFRFLQPILDGSDYIDTADFGRINIKKGFKMIMTFNLDVDGDTYGIPTPLVDRASSIIQMKNTASKMAVNAF